MHQSTHLTKWSFQRVYLLFIITFALLTLAVSMMFPQPIAAAEISHPLPDNTVDPNGLLIGNLLSSGQAATVSNCDDNSICNSTFVVNSSAAFTTDAGGYSYAPVNNWGDDNPVIGWNIDPARIQVYEGSQYGLSGNILHYFDSQSDYACAYFNLSSCGPVTFDAGTNYCAVAEVAAFGLDAGTLIELELLDATETAAASLTQTRNISGLTDNGTFTDGSDLTSATWDTIVFSPTLGATIPATVTKVSFHIGGGLTSTDVFVREFYYGPCQTEVEDYLCAVPDPIPASIGNYVWLDENDDGLQDAGERGIPNAEVILYDNSCTELARTVTDENGNYLFTGLAAGTYRVDVPTAQTALTGRLQSTHPVLPGADFGNQNPKVTGCGYELTVAEGEENLTADFGFVDENPNGNSGTAALGDRVWLDTDGDGAQDAGEMGIADVCVELFALGTDGVFDAGADGVYGTADDDETSLGTQQTDATGYYFFDSLNAGGYVVQMCSTNPALSGLTQTGDPDHFGTTGTNDGMTTSPVVLAPGDVFVNVDFGYQPTSSSYCNTIGDLVYLDADSDGVYESADGEYGIPNVTVALINDVNGDGVWDRDGVDNTFGTADDELIVGQDMTDDSGVYGFDCVPDGDYLVWVNDTETVLTYLSQTIDSDGTSTPNISAVSVSGGSTNNDQDFGYAPAKTSNSNCLVGDQIFFDNDADNTYDNGEGMEGIVVRMYAADGTTLLATTTTDENGHYYFPVNCLAGAVTVTVRVDTSTMPPGLTNTVDPDGGTASESIVSVGGANPAVNLSQDFGYRSTAAKSGSIGNLVWLDVNADGDVDSGENGIECVTIDLYWDKNGDGDLDPDEPRLASQMTDASGAYLFTNLASSDVDYIIDVSDRKGVLAGHWHSLGSQDLTSNDQSKADPYAVSLTLVTPNVLTVDFGYYVDLAAVGNYVWFDANGDGQQAGSGTDYGLNGVPVTLTIRYGGGEVVMFATNTMTDPTGTTAGYYSFANLLADEDFNGAGASPAYTISVGTVPGLAPTVVDTGSDLTDSDLHEGVSADPMQGQTNTALSNTTDAIASYDFGFTLPGAIGDYVWYDTDNDGLQDAGESGIANVLVGLYDSTCTTLIDSEYTNSNGGYLFDALAPGDYCVQIIDDLGILGGLTATSGLQVHDGNPITLSPGESHLDADFGYVRDPGPSNAIIGDTVWYDYDGNGVQDPGEPGIPGVVIQVTDGTTTYTATTDALGNYYVTVPAGTYTVTVDTATLPVGVTQTYDLDELLDNTTTVTVASGEQVLTADFGYDLADLGRIGNQVWYDTNQDGLFSSGTENGVPGVTVELIRDSNGDGVWTPGELIISSVTTDANGQYAFEGLTAGNYLVFVSDNSRVLLGWSPTTPGTAGTDNNSQSMPYAVNLPASGENLTADFGFFQPGIFGNPLGAIGNQIWADVDGDGVYSASAEDGIAGVVVELIQGGTVIMTTTTNSEGRYLFTNLPAGSYDLRVNDVFGVLTGYTAAPIGGTPGADNNNQAQDYTINLGAGEINLTGDFAYVAPREATAIALDGIGVAQSFARPMLLAVALLGGVTLGVMWIDLRREGNQ